MAQHRVLTSDQVEQFLEHGFVVIRGAFSRRVADALTGHAWKQLGYDPDDPSTWEAAVRAYARDAPHRRADVRAEGVGRDVRSRRRRGPDVSHRPYFFNDAFIVNLALGADQPWITSPAAIGGWHKDGDNSRHFLDSPEFGLLTLVLWTDVHHQGGATMLAADSVRPVARFLAANPARRASVRALLPRGASRNTRAMRYSIIRR